MVWELINLNVILTWYSMHIFQRQWEKSIIKTKLFQIGIVGQVANHTFIESSMHQMFIVPCIV